MEENARRSRDDDFRYEIVRHFGILSTSAKGWTKEFNSVSWNGKSPKYDIRDWSAEHQHMSRGINWNSWLNSFPQSSAQHHKTYGVSPAGFRNRHYPRRLRRPGGPRSAFLNSEARRSLSADFRGGRGMRKKDVRTSSIISVTEDFPAAVAGRGESFVFWKGKKLRQERALMV